MSGYAWGRGAARKKLVLPEFKLVDADFGPQLGGKKSIEWCNLQSTRPEEDDSNREQAQLSALQVAASLATASVDRSQEK